jgi:hypothetical protein
MKPRNVKRIVIAILVLNASTLFSQIVNKLGFKSGLSISQIEWKYTSNTYTNINLKLDDRIGCIASVYGEFLNQKYYCFNADLGYIEKGGKAEIIFVDEYNNFNSTKDITSKLDYLKLNVQIKGKYEIRRFIPYLALGCGLNYLINQTNLFSELTKINKTMYSIVYNFGLEYDFKKYILFIDVSNNLNLNKIADFKNIGTDTDITINDKTYTIQLGISIKI